MRVLFSHNNFPAQFRRIAPALADKGHDVVFLAQNREWHAPPSAGIRLKEYKTHRHGGGEALHPYLRRFESCVLHGQAVYRACEQLKQEGWEPDWIINHVGFGNGLYLSDAFPEARRIGFFEWYYNSKGADVDFLHRGQLEPDRTLRLRTWNAQTLLEIADCHCGVVPTQWQLDQFPQHLRSRMRVIHEGIDVETLANLKISNRSRPPCLPDDPKVEVLTYVSRGFEPYRGFPEAMQTIALLQSQRPNLHALIVGSDVVAYGGSRPDGRSWGAWAKEEIALDVQRTHWMGALQTQEYHDVLAWSDVHLYLTVPFVLSWSLLEAMAAGCALVCSATPPVEEVLEHGSSALLVDFFSSQAQAAAIARLLDSQELRFSLALQAKQRASEYRCQKGQEAWMRLLSGYGDQTAP